MSNQQPLENVQLLWDVKDIQEFIEPPSCLQECTGDLLTLDLGSNWLTTLGITKQSLPASSSNVMQQKDRDQGNITSSSEIAKDCGNERTNQNSEIAIFANQTDAPVSVTTLGLLLLSTITCQKGSQSLKQSIIKLIVESYSNAGFHEQLQKWPNLRKSNVDGLCSFVNFCIGHCSLCNADGGIVRDAGILRVWADVVQPLRNLLESVITDHIQESETWTLPIPKPTNVSSVKSSLSQQKAAIYARLHSYDFANDKRYQAGVQQIMKQLQAEGGGHNTNQKDLELQAKVFYFSRFFHKVTKDDYQMWLAHNQETNSNSTSSKSLSHSQSLAENALTTSKLSATKSTCSSQSAHSTAANQVGPSAVRDTMPSGKTSVGSESDDTDKQVGDPSGLPASQSHCQQPGACSLPSTSSEESPADPTDSNAQEVTSDLQPVTSDPPPYPASFLEILQLVQSGQEIPGLEILDIKPTNAEPTVSQMEPVTKPWLK